MRRWWNLTPRPPLHGWRGWEGGGGIASRAEIAGATAVPAEASGATLREALHAIPAEIAGASRAPARVNKESTRLPGLVLVVFLAVWGPGGLGCTTATPQVSYYEIALPSGYLPPKGEAVVVIDQILADRPLDDPRMLYRESAFRLDHYYYHRWPASPALMLADYLREALERTGEFKAVTAGHASGAGVVISGHLSAFEEVDTDKNAWVARVVLQLHGRVAATGEIVWSERIAEDEPMNARTPIGLARALSSALSRGVKKLVPGLAAVANQAHAAGKAAGKGGDAGAGQ